MFTTGVGTPGRAGAPESKAHRHDHTERCCKCPAQGTQTPRRLTKDLGRPQDDPLKPRHSPDKGTGETARGHSGQRVPAPGLSHTAGWWPREPRCPRQRPLRARPTSVPSG